MTEQPKPLVTDVASAPGAGYAELLRVPAMSVGMFAAPTGHVDTQQPHAEDEVYVVASGTAVLEIAAERHAVGPGSIAFVPARVPHRFLDIEGELRVWVVFAPAET